MAKQSSIFNFFTKSPPPVAKAKSNPSPAEADLPSSVSKSNTSPKEEAKLAAQSSSRKTATKPDQTSAKAGHAKLFGEKAVAPKQRYFRAKSLFTTELAEQPECSLPPLS